jgi:outer membrane lipoprotein carrier protein
MKRFIDGGQFRRCSTVMMLASFLLIIGMTLFPFRAFAGDTIDAIIAGVEARYNVPGFTAEFDQESILKAMAVTDTASGTLMVRQPGKMRWEYIVPDPQTIITDGNDLWMYRPEENQVMVGKAPAFFGKGKGAGFLSNIKIIREGFQISQESEPDPKFYRLKLVPNKSSADLIEMQLDIAKKTFDLIRVITFNVYGDETRIELKNCNFAKVPPEDLFQFTIPEGADVVQMNQ